MRRRISTFGETRAPITLVDWINVNPFAGWGSGVGGTIWELIPAGKEPEGYVPGGGRCIRLAQDPNAARIAPRIQRTLAAAVDLVDERTVVQCPVYYPGEFSTPTFAGLQIALGSGGSLTNNYLKTFYPSGGDTRKGWCAYSFPLQTMSIGIGAISMSKTGTPAINSMNFMRLMLENSTNNAVDANEIYIGPITARRKQRTLVTISFDDGNISIYDNGSGISAKNELAARGLKANCFIITNPISDVAGAKMSWAQLRDLQNNYGWTIGGHSLSHANFLAAGTMEISIKKEVEECIKTLRAQGFKCDFFAWPGGAYTETAKQYAKSMGIKLCYDIGSTICYAPWAWGSGDFGCEYRFASESTATATTGATGAINYLDEAIAAGGNFHIYTHDIVAGASGANSVNITEFQTMLDAIRARVRQGLIDVVTLDEFYARQVSGRALAP